MHKTIKYGLLGIMMMLVTTGSAYLVKLLDWALNTYFPTADGFLKFGIPIAIVLLFIVIIGLAVGVAVWKILK